MLSNTSASSLAVKAPAPVGGSGAAITFSSPGLAEWLACATDDALDALPFGLVAMDRDGVVTWYNRCEAGLSGLTPSRVIGRNFFTSVALCTNNAMIADRFKTQAEIDDVIDYVFTFKIAPVEVRIRLIKQEGSPAMYLAVERRR